MLGLKEPTAMMRRGLTRPLALVKMLWSKRGVSEGVPQIIMSALRICSLERREYSL